MSALLLYAAAALSGVSLGRDVGGNKKDPKTICLALAIIVIVIYINTRN